MKYSREWLIERAAVGDAVDYLFFWGHTPRGDGRISASCFSQWWAGHPFHEGDVTYATAEHYMMAGKAKLFADDVMLDKILAAADPATAKKLGRQVKDFDDAKWKAERLAIVTAGNMLKFSQHQPLADFLLATGDKILVEAAPRDRIWGIGLGRDNERARNPAQWRGANLLGFCLMEVRDRLLG